MTISVIIPTKNRLQDLVKAFDSIVNQTIQPNQLIFIDQSESPIPERTLSEMRGKLIYTNIIYHYDTAITGLVHAKFVGVGIATEDIVCFLEDDVVLENDYFSAIMNGFKSNLEMVGSSGVITNPPFFSKVYLLSHNLFHRGIYFDPRPSFYMRALSGYQSLICSPVLSGGLSAWKREVLENVKFDVYNSFHMIEDFEFSSRVNRIYQGRLFINPRAKLAHYFAFSGRDNEYVKNKRKVIEYITFYKKNKKESFAFFSIFWLIIGLFFTAASRSMQIRNLAPVKGILNGIVDGYRYKLIKL